MAKSAAPSGTRDFLADDLRRRRAAFTTVSDIFERYGFDPLETPAFERLEVLTGKYGEEASQLLFKILRRGVHEASGKPDLALRYDHTVPLARVIGTHGAKLPNPYKRYAIGPVWRADRPQEGRFREFVQCDIDTVGSSSPLADAEVVLALAESLDALGVNRFRFLVNSREALRGLLEVYGVAEENGDGVLSTLDKLDKVGAGAVAKELVDERGLDVTGAERLAEDVASDDQDLIRSKLATNERGQRGLAQIDSLLELTASLGDRAVFAPRMVRGLDYYTGAIYEVEAEGFPGSIAAGGRYDGLVASLGGPDMPACGGSIGIERILAMQDTGDAPAVGLDVAITVLGGQAELMKLASELRTQGLRVGTYLGSSGKLGKQLQWANAQHARFAVIFGPEEQESGEVTIRDMVSGDQNRIPLAQVGADFRARIEG
ncbi:histidine--tRNA ligase [Nocardiopsis terrae]|uniref:Histidine--tRNA ligase n=1 Tax=Nocardiopsis terrae TaxID=372655 RepID=A0ABR9HFT7_9ACTN|nr:histidine--tRNA ligase [Nocardiopsis terrae]MBE1457859.1 histidyl-tRNA synthetase [Nocardiopsis terrae]GHC83880.1 histidine--tRNA ligase [Nocardiopsis terrae]